jgi:hypothetical protein
MKASTKTQIKSGLRVGGQLGLFFIAAMILGVAIDGIQAGAGHLKPWPDGAIAAGLIAMAMAILLLTARVWILYIAGCLLFAIPKCLMLIASGRNFYSPHEPFSRLVAAELGLFFLVSLFLVYRLTVNQAPAVVDRLAFTFFMFSLVFGLSQRNFALVAIWQIAGLAALCLAWLFSRNKHRAHSRAPVH